MDRKEKQLKLENGRVCVVAAQYFHLESAFIGSTHEEVTSTFAFLCKSLSLIPSSSRLFQLCISRMSQPVSGYGTGSV